MGSIEMVDENIAAGEVFLGHRLSGRYHGLLDSRSVKANATRIKEYDHGTEREN